MIKTLSTGQTWMRKNTVVLEIMKSCGSAPKMPSLARHFVAMASQAMM